MLGGVQLLVLAVCSPFLVAAVAAHMGGDARLLDWLAEYLRVGAKR